MTKKYLYILSTVALTACAESDEMTENPFLNGVEKTPVETAVLLDVTAASNTRAANKEFHAGDKLLAYLRHVTWDVSTGARTLVNVQNSPKLVTFTKGVAACSAYNGSDIIPIGTGTALGLSSDNTMQTSDLTTSPALYWDDFSRASTGEEAEGACDIRTPGHYLQSFYGYCFNGGEGENNAQGTSVNGNITTALNAETGVLGWTVPYDQTTQKTFTGCDLLWSAEQTPIRYAHGSQNVGGQHGTLILPYTHAMSMVTVVVVAKDGFTTGALENTWLELKEMNKTATFNAPKLTITGAGQGTDGKQGLVKMFKGTETSNAEGHPTCTFQALVVPQTALSENMHFLTINDADGNKYHVYINGSMLISWASGLTDGKKMQSGINYKLTVTINKVGMDVQTTLSDWKIVEADGEGEIQFTEKDLDKIYTSNEDLSNNRGEIDLSTTEGAKKAKFKVGSSFTLYQKEQNETETFYNKTTISTYTAGSSNYWHNDPEIYWPNDHTNYFFRALAIYEGEDDVDGYKIAKYTNEDYAVEQGTDYVWATTPPHVVKASDGTLHSYQKGVDIRPRTGDVPLAFEHVMSKITLKLNTPSDASGVELAEAKVSISNLSKEGRVDVNDGKVTANSAVENPIVEYNPSGNDGGNTLDNYAVIPQEITDRSIVTVKLSDGTTYKIQLNTCKDNNTRAEVRQWFRGIHYIYTITLTKEAISFRALIKEWEEQSGSGNANLDWD